MRIDASFVPAVATDKGKPLFPEPTVRDELHLDVGMNVGVAQSSNAATTDTSS